MFVVKLLWRTFSYHSKEKHPNLDFFSMRELLYDANINTDWAYYDLSFVNSDLKWRCHSSRLFCQTVTLIFKHKTGIQSSTMSSTEFEYEKTDEKSFSLYRFFPVDCYLYNRTILISSIK